jgi:hypothetical protein
MSATSFNGPSPYPDLVVKRTRAERTEAAANRKAHLVEYRTLGRSIPNDENWDPFDGHKRNYRLARKALNCYLYNMGRPWKGTLKGVVEFVIAYEAREPWAYSQRPEAQ